MQPPSPLSIATDDDGLCPVQQIGSGAGSNWSNEADVFSPTGQIFSPNTKEPVESRKVHEPKRQIDWNEIPLVTGALYVKYGAVYFLCDCSVTANSVTFNPRDPQRQSIEFDVKQVIETKLLLFWHYYEKDMFEVVLRGTYHNFLRPTVAYTSTSSNGSEQALSTSISPPPEGLPERTDAPAPEHQILSEVEVGHQGGEGFTVLTLKAFGPNELTEWVEALRETQGEADTIAEFSDSFARRSPSASGTGLPHSKSDVNFVSPSSRKPLPSSKTAPSLDTQLSVMLKRTLSKEEVDEAESSGVLLTEGGLLTLVPTGGGSSGREDSGHAIVFEGMRSSSSAIAPSRSAVRMDPHAEAPAYRPVYGKGYYCVEGKK